MTTTFRLFAALLVVAIHTSPLSSFNSSTDFIFTRVLAGMAVPFFLMVTGYFLLPQYLFEHTKDFRPLFLSIKKTLLLYAAAIALYLPVNFYAGQLHGANIFDLFRVFSYTRNGIFYAPVFLVMGAGMKKIRRGRKKGNYPIRLCLICSADDL